MSPMPRTGLSSGQALDGRPEPIGRTPPVLVLESPHHDEYWAVESGMLEGRPPTSLTAQHERRHGVWRDEGAQDEQQRR
jgi:hypothetical protein